jgi:hypothetical protein
VRKPLLIGFPAGLRRAYAYQKASSLFLADLALPFQIEAILREKAGNGHAAGEHANVWGFVAG